MTERRLSSILFFAMFALPILGIVVGVICGVAVKNLGPVMLLFWLLFVPTVIVSLRGWMKRDRVSGAIFVAAILIVVLSMGSKAISLWLMG